MSSAGECDGQVSDFLPQRGDGRSLELDPDGHIDCAYVHPDHRRKGVVSALVQHAVDTCFACGIRRVTVEASICARPMFERAGFRTLSRAVVTIKGVELVNFPMERLASDEELTAAPNVSRQ